MGAGVSTRGERRGEELGLLAEAVFSVLGVCRVGLTGDAGVLVEGLAARGMICPERGPFDAWVLLTDIVRLEQGEGFPPSNDDHPLFVACRMEAVAKGDVPLRARIEAAVIHRGYIKHPATTELFGYSQLDANQNECWAIFDFRPPVFADGDTPARLKSERDLHSDMLREPGIRSDAHVVRYQLAASLVRPNDVVLDAACGLGYGSHILANLSPAAQVSGIDLSDWAVDFATRNYGGERVSFSCGSLPEGLDNMPDNSVDFVVSLETLEHVPNPAALLEAFERVLKPGGRIFVSVPNDWADETGEDPNPHHLHVYDWTRVHSELARHFIVESAWSLTASGCKSGLDRVWRPQPRKLEQVPLCEAPTTEGEWWLVCATKSPLARSANTYVNTVHAGFLGRTHLVDFAANYDCPWIVHALVELPWRIRDKVALSAIAQEVIAGARPDSADLGAGLAVLGWRVLEDSGPKSRAADEWLKSAGSYIVAGRNNPNPHVGRWCISLDYLYGRFLEARGEVVSAIDAYWRVANADVLRITPTLGTKVADAALRVGMLAFREGRAGEAVKFWQRGLDSVFCCLRADPLEFVGNPDNPFIFAMNDLVEMADGAVRLANSIRALAACDASNRAVAARQLGTVAHHSLRSALAQLQGTVTRLTDELNVIAKQLDRTEQAKATAEELAHSHLSKLEALQAQLTATEAAKANAEELAISRYDELNILRSEIESIRKDFRKTRGELDRSNDRIAKIQDSKGYKLLATLRLAPTKDIADV